MRRFLDLVRKNAAEVELRDVFVFGGLACGAIGAAQIYGPAGWIVVGAALFWLGIRRS
jgi:hypothetical protein